MCGISGIISKKEPLIDKSLIKRMNDTIIHRGPDAEGYFFDNYLSFGHRRLSIIDLSENSNQPFHYGDRYTIIFNGEIYNYLEIKNELVVDGYKFTTGSDTEVIAASYDRWGKLCVNHFNGMWAFAIYDKRTKTIFCSRDRFGVKPFYYFENDEIFAFGSEIKQLIPFLNKPIVNKNLLLDYLIIGFEEHLNETFFTGINKLEQSHSLIYSLDTNHYEIFRHYELNVDYNLAGLTENESINKFTECFYNSINLRLRSDVKVGTCLSGGLDSSTVAAIASIENRKTSGNKFNAITAKSIENEIDETVFASKVATNSNLEWNIVTPSTDDFINEIEKVIRIQEEPFGSPSIFMQYKVFEKAREIGCLVMLDGQGGDETLLGYESYYPSYLLSLKFIKMIREFFNSSKNSRLRKLELINYMFYFTNAKIRERVLKSKFSFLKPFVFNLISRRLLLESAQSYKNITKMQKLEIEKIQLPHLLKYEDKNSMSHSVESRLPYLDYKMVECSLSLNNNLKIKSGWTKYILRKSFEKNLPSEISWRKNKLGFNAPEKTWLSAMNQKMLTTIGSSIIISEISDTKNLILVFDKLDLRTKWKLYNIAQWEKEFGVIWD